MKYIITLFAVAMLCATFAVSAGAGNGGQSGITNTTIIEGSTITTGKGGKTQIGVVTNEGGAQDGVRNETTISDSQITVQRGETAGAAEEMETEELEAVENADIEVNEDGLSIGSIRNNGGEQKNVTRSTTLSNVTIINKDGKTTVYRKKGAKGQEEGTKP